MREETGFYCYFCQHSSDIKAIYITESVTCKKVLDQITYAVKSKLHCRKKFGPEPGLTFSIFTVVQIY